ncbi:MAG TPA: hypothetical protein DGT23_29880 [Micromonosporaceae bacterium]|nr:hypothetical protein [Micromonosporaceae bacterium]
MSSLRQFPGTGRSRFGMLAAAGIAVVAVLAVILFVMSPRDGEAPGVPTASQPASQFRPPRPQPSASAAASPAVIPTTAPAGISWALVGQSAVPVSGTDGPAQVGGCRASGYAHTPVGALIAAAQISTRSGYSAGRQCWEPALTGQFVASADRDTLLGLLNNADAAGHPAAAPGELAQISGFRFVSYTGDTAVIGLIRRTPQGSHAQTTLTVQWADGDWKLVAPSGGQWPAITAALTSLAGTTPWGAG